MLSKKNRFHGLGSLNQVYRRGSSIRSPYCAIKFLRPGKTDNFRVAVVVSKKVAKSAPKRNLIRRRVYEAIRLNADLLKNEDLVVNIFDDRFAELPFDQLCSSIKRQLVQITRST